MSSSQEGLTAAKPALVYNIGEPASISNRQQPDQQLDRPRARRGSPHHIRPDCNLEEAGAGQPGPAGANAGRGGGRSEGMA